MLVAKEDQFNVHVRKLEDAKQQWERAETMLFEKENRNGHRDLADLSSLSNLLAHLSRCRSSIDRGKVYAVLGLVRNADYDILVDYSVHTTDVDVLIDTAKAIIQVEQKLDILAVPSPMRWAHGARYASDRLPSWAPNWFGRYEDMSTVHQYHHTLWPRHQPAQQGDHWGRASRDTIPDVSFEDDRHGDPDRVLRARGIYVTVLDQVIGQSSRPGWDRSANFQDGLRTDFYVETTAEASGGCEIWVLFGADKPLVLSRLHRNSRRRCILGPALSGIATIMRCPGFMGGI